MLYACNVIQKVIDIYSRASGQVVNMTKSSIVFSKNVGTDVQEFVSSVLGMEVVESHEKYLGLPIYVGKKKTETFLYIKDRLEERLAGRSQFSSFLRK